MKNRLTGVWLFFFLALPCLAREEPFEETIEGFKTLMGWIWAYVLPTLTLTVVTCGLAYKRWRNVKIWHYSPLVFGFWAFLYILYLALRN
ncbi:MAG: hypothetical protein QNK37_12490 [Acidobacteriota bacterium]|nr:hypothetical protein [Acidobacteriota bacterium]